MSGLVWDQLPAHEGSLGLLLLLRGDVLEAVAGGQGLMGLGRVTVLQDCCSLLLCCGLRWLIILLGRLREDLAFKDLPTCLGLLGTRIGILRSLV